MNTTSPKTNDTEQLARYKYLGFNAFLIMGAISTYISAVMPVIRERLALNYEQVGLIFASNSVGFFIGALLIGVVIDYMGTKKPLYLGCFALPVGIVIFALAPSAALLSLGNMIIGFGVSTLEVAIPPISGKFKGKSGEVLNLIHAFFALGSMISPLIASLLITSSLKYTLFFYVIASYTFVPLYYSRTLKIHLRAKSKEQRKGETKAEKPVTVLKNKYLWLVSAGIFFYVASEIGVFSWAPMYSTDYIKTGEGLASLLPSLFWVGLLIGRFMSSKWVDKVGHLKWLLIVTSIGLPVTFLCQRPFPNYGFMAPMIVISGLIHASIFPTLQSLLVERINTGLGLALSIFSASASLGSLMAGFVIGKISDLFGIQWGYFFPFFLFLGTFSMVAIIFLVDRKKG